MSPTAYIAGALLVVVVLRMVAPLAAAILGVGITLGIAYWGYQLYASGAGLALAGMHLSLPVFITAVAFLLGFEILNLVIAVRRRRSPQNS